jgi:broad specificity phosphatase PhoE
MTDIIMACLQKNIINNFIKGERMNLLIIRHGQSEADILEVMEGRADFNLTELGRNVTHSFPNFYLNLYIKL